MKHELARKRLTTRQRAPDTPFTRHNRLSTGCQTGCTTGLTTGCIVCVTTVPTWHY